MAKEILHLIVFAMFSIYYLFGTIKEGKKLSKLLNLSHITAKATLPFIKELFLLLLCGFICGESIYTLFK